MAVKAALFLLLGLLSAGRLLAMQPSLETALLLFAAIWAFCRLYYFAFYVVERYVDPSFRFSGIGGFLCYLARRKIRGESTRATPLKAAGRSRGKRSPSTTLRASFPPRAASRAKLCFAQDVRS
jgi:hypothetical protein